MPDVPLFEENLALTQTDLAQLYLESGETKHVEPLASRALDVFTALSQQSPEMPRYIEERAACQDVLARVWGDFGRNDEARKALDRSIGALGDLAARFPEISPYRVRLAVAHSRLGQILHKLGEEELSRENFESAIDGLRGQLRRTPDATATRDTLARVCERFGHFWMETNRPETAVEFYQRAGDIWETLAADTAAPEYQARYARFLSTCPCVELRDPDRAVEFALLARRAVPENPDYLSILAMAKLRQGKWKDAEQNLLEARRLRGRDHGCDLFLLSIARRHDGQHEAAREAFDKAVQWMKEYAPENHELERLRREAEELLLTPDRPE
jgi:tetratricopeptide (TPR) repeat protein